MITEAIAAAAVYHHKLDCRNCVVLSAPLGRVYIMPLIKEEEPDIRITPPRMVPAFPTASNPSPARALTAIKAPNAMREKTAMAKPVQATYPRSFASSPVPGAALVTCVPFPALVKSKVVMLIHSVPTEAMALPKASLIAPTKPFMTASKAPLAPSETWHPISSRSHIS